jgi:hypothetical protein
VNGWSAITGPEGYGGNFWSLFLILIPVAIFVFVQFKDSLSFVKGRLFLLTTALFALGIIMLLIFSSRVNSVFLVLSSLSAAYYISLVLYIIAGILSVGCLISARKGQ